MARFYHCRNCGFSIMDTGERPLPCSECKEPRVIRGVGYNSYNLVQQALWGSDATPVYNEGLDEWTSGKKDMEAKAAANGLRHREPGEPRRTKSREEYHREHRKPIYDAANLREFDL